MTSDAAILGAGSRAHWLKFQALRLVGLPDLVFVALAAAVIYPVASAPIGSGDYGQWLMVSRFFSGEEVPGYRDILAVAPIVPAFLALVRTLVGDPVVALNVTRVCIMAALVFGFYLAGGSLFRSRGAGLLAAALAFSLTERFLELFAFGGLLQAASLAFMLAGLAALGRAAASLRHDQAWWSVATACMAVAVLSHAGSVVIVIPVGVATGVAVMILTWRRRGSIEWIRTLTRSMILPSLAVAYWVIVLVPANQGYADNPATESFRGPGRLFDPLFAPERLTVWLLVIGFAAIGQGVVREVLARRPAGYCLTAVWTGATWAVLLLAITTGTATDYPRFAGPLLAPLAVGAGGALAETVKSLTGAAGGIVSQSRTSAGLAGAVGIVMLLGGPDQFRAFAIHNRSYAVGERSSIEALAERIDSQLGSDQSVLVLEPRDGKWVEGLTGRAALFANKTRYSFREHEWERSAAADAMVRSTTAAVNGLVSAKFMSSAPAERGEDLPRELLVGVNHDGEWVDLLRFPENHAVILMSRQFAGTTLARMRPVALHRSESEQAVSIETEWAGTAGDAALHWTRTVTISRDSPTVDIVDQFTSSSHVGEIQLEVAGFRPGMAAEVSDEGAVVRFPKMGRRQPEVELRVVDNNGEFERRGDALVVRFTDSSRLHLQVTARSASRPISELALLNPHQLMEDYQVGAAILRIDGAFKPRLRRLQALGLCEEAQAGSYVLLTLRCAGREPISPADSEDPEVGSPGPMRGGGGGG